MAYPSFSKLFSVVRPSIRASLTRLFTGDEADAAMLAAAGVNDRDHRIMPP